MPHTNSEEPSDIGFHAELTVKSEAGAGGRLRDTCNQRRLGDRLLTVLASEAGASEHHIGAAEIAVGVITAALAASAEAPDADELKRAFIKANDRIRQEQESAPAARGLSCRAVAISFSEKVFSIAYTGESPVYLYREGSLYRLQQPDTMPDYEPMAGQGALRVCSVSMGACIGDRLLICSPALPDILVEEEVHEVLSTALRGADALEELLQFGRSHAHGKGITLQLIEIDEPPLPSLEDELTTSAGDSEAEETAADDLSDSGRFTWSGEGEWILSEHPTVDELVAYQEYLVSNNKPLPRGFMEKIEQLRIKEDAEASPFDEESERKINRIVALGALLSLAVVGAVLVYLQKVVVNKDTAPTAVAAAPTPGAPDAEGRAREPIRFDRALAKVLYADSLSALGKLYRQETLDALAAYSHLGSSSAAEIIAASASGTFDLDDFKKRYPALAAMAQAAAETQQALLDGKIDLNITLEQLQERSMNDAELQLAEVRFQLEVLDAESLDELWKETRQGLAQTKAASEEVSIHLGTALEAARFWRANRDSLRETDLVEIARSVSAEDEKVGAAKTEYESAAYRLIDLNTATAADASNSVLREEQAAAGVKVQGLRKVLADAVRPYVEEKIQASSARLAAAAQLWNAVDREAQTLAKREEVLKRLRENGSLDRSRDELLAEAARLEAQLAKQR